MNTSPAKQRKWPDDYSLSELLDELESAAEACGFTENEDRSINSFAEERRAIVDQRLTDLLAAIKTLYVWSRPQNLQRVLRLYHGDKIHVNSQENSDDSGAIALPPGYGPRPGVTP